MSSLSKIVKSHAVVDDRPKPGISRAEELKLSLGKKPVIKRNAFLYRENPYADLSRLMPDKQGYVDELNRVRAEIAQAKAELRSLGRMIDEAVEERGDAGGEDEAEIMTRNAAVAQAEAERILKEAKAEAAAMREEAQAEAEQLAMQARNDGYLEGFARGSEDAAAEFRAQNEPKIRELGALLDRLSDFEEEQIARNEKNLLDLVMAVAKKVVGQELKTDHRAIVQMLYQVLDDNRREQTVRVTVSQELMPAEAKASAEIRKLITQTAPSALLYVDEELPEGSVVVETDKGITDLSVGTQLENIAAMLSEE